MRMIIRQAGAIALLLWPGAAFAAEPVRFVPSLDDDYINSAIEELRQIDPDYLITAHCTGDRFYDLARAALGEKVIHSAVGTRFVFEKT